MSLAYHAGALEVARRFYDAGADGHARYRADAFIGPKWQNVRTGLVARLNDGQHNFALEALSQQISLLPAIESWLLTRGISEISFVNRGTDAVVFEAKMPANAVARTVFRLGDAQSAAEKMNFERVWCPLVLQPYQSAALHDSSQARLKLELSPLLGVEQRAREIPLKFINGVILRGTPFALEVNKEVGSLFNGGTVFVDPDSLGFRTAIMAKKLFKRQFDAEWQRRIMQKIADNCQATGWPVDFWLARAGDRFITRQDALYPNPWPGRPAREVINLPAVVRPQ